MNTYVDVTVHCGLSVKVKTAFLEKQFFQKAHAFMVMIYDGKAHNTRKYNHTAYFFYKFRGCFKNTYELLNLRALKFSPVNKDILCRISKGTKISSHTLKDEIYMKHWSFKSS